jgi:predicted nuclease of predicted toxin-antitoxin system
MTRKKYLIDNNLPYYFSLWNKDEYIHQFDLGDDWHDRRIWEYAMEHKLTIVTKDSDFSNRILFKEPPPRIIHIHLGNMRMKEFHKAISSVWVEVTRMSEEYKLVNVFSDHLEGIR